MQYGHGRVGLNTGYSGLPINNSVAGAGPGATRGAGGNPGLNGHPAAERDAGPVSVGNMVGGLFGQRQGSNPGQPQGVSGLGGPGQFGGALPNLPMNQLGGQLGNLNLQGGGHSSVFSIQTEDFPALPSAAAGGGMPRRGVEEIPGMGGNFQHPLQHGGNAAGGYDQQALWNQQQQQKQQQMQQPGGNPQLMRPGGKQQQQQQQQQQQPPGSGPNAPDRFGLLGLLSVMRMTDQDLTTLALGTDLTTLGLNLNSSDNLYKTFGSPWADWPVRAEPDYQVPSCYLHTPARLQSAYFTKFQQDTLFYIFYSMPGDEAQIFAADELSNRGWYFHKEMKMWLRRVPNSETTAKSDRFERSSFFIFDTSTWEVVRKDSFGLSYDSLERAPNLPRSSAQAQAQAQSQPPPPQQQQQQQQRMGGGQAASNQRGRGGNQ